MSDLQLALTELLPSITEVTRVSGVHGGSISQAHCATVLRDGSRGKLFAKSNDASFLDNFRAECDGLSRLSQVGAMAVPDPLAVGVVGDQAWLVTTWIEQGPAGSDFFADFGRRLADLHRQTLGQEIGLDRDNFLGSATQTNTPSVDWAPFVASHRIGFQIRWAVDQGVADDNLKRDCERICDSMSELLAGREERTSLLHGDLWSGNYLCAVGGDPVLVDPAVYHGCREAEFGMLRLFGSCPSEFYDAYEDAFPLPGGWQRRVNVYVLYHLLNHLNLFGGGYREQSRRLAAEILRHDNPL